MKKNLDIIAKRIWKDLRQFGLPIGLYVIYHLVMLKLYHASCPLLLTLGIPCPGCGMTRAIASIIKFDFENAFYLNPVAFAVVLFIIVFVITRYIFGKKPRFIKVLFWIIIVFLFIRYFYGMFKWFPNRIPYVYRKKNLVRFWANLMMNAQ